MVNEQQLQLELPSSNWVPVPEPEGLIFLAERRGNYPDVRPNLSADIAALAEGSTIEDAADAVLGRLRGLDANAKLAKRQVDGDTSVLQQVEFELPTADGVQVRLAQVSTLVEAPTQSGEERAVMCVMLTAALDDIDRHAADYQAFLESAHAI